MVSQAEALIMQALHKSSVSILMRKLSLLIDALEAETPKDTGYTSTQWKLLVGNDSYTRDEVGSVTYEQISKVGELHVINAAGRYVIGLVVDDDGVPTDFTEAVLDEMRDSNTKG